VVHGWLSEVLSESGGHRYSPELNLFNESKEIEYDQARIKIDIKAFVISYVDFTLTPTLYGGHCLRCNIDTSLAGLRFIIMRR